MLPQFDFSTYSSQIFWLLICFGILFFFIKNYFIKNISKTLLLRNIAISSDATIAKENMQKVKEFDEECEKKLIHAKKQSEELMQRALEKTKHEMSLLMQNTTRQIDTEVKIMQDKIQSEVESYFKNKLISDVTTVTQFLISHLYNTQESEEKIKQAIIGKSNHN